MCITPPRGMSVDCDTRMALWVRNVKLSPREYVIQATHFLHIHTKDLAAS